MNPQQELPPDSSDQRPVRDAQAANTERPITILQASLPASESEPTSTKSPTLLDVFYYWVMSRL
jgi:hypothetical protein